MPKFNAVALPLAAFSIGLGLAELFATEKVGKAAGIPQKSGLLKAYGLREIMAGGLILAAPKSQTPLWMRVAGDFVDLLTLAPATRRNDEPGGKQKATIAAAVVAGITAIDILAASSRKQAG